MTQSWPVFSKLDIQTFPVQLKELLSNNQQKIQSLLEKEKEFTWDNLMALLEDMENEVERFWQPFAHLHAVVDSPSLRQCYKDCLPMLSAYESAIGHNHELYSAIQSIDRTGLNSTQQNIIHDTLRDFTLSGVALSESDKQRFEAITKRLSELSNQFENNILDAVEHYQLPITDEDRLKGLPEHAVFNAKRLAEEKKSSGWILNLEYPCYLAVITYAEDRSLREEMYQAFVTRASDVGPLAGQFDNTTIMNEILALRYEKSQLLGFPNYAALSLATKMAESTDSVLGFLKDLSTRARGQAQQEFDELVDFARKSLNLKTLEPWDVAYASEKKQQAEYAISQEKLRAFFPLPTVMKGLFDIVKRLYGMTFVECRDVDVWHSDVTCYRIEDKQKEVRGYIYIDLFARSRKRSGAWMDSLQGRYLKANGQTQLPMATLTCNFAKSGKKQNATLSHDEVITLFHEFGHCFHHVLTGVNYLSASGINGVEWDAVELPSQFFENWCWNEEALQLLSSHVDTGEPLPASLLKQLLAAKNFQSAMGMMRQLEFSWFDFRIHQEYDPSLPNLIESVLKEVREQTTVVPVVSYNRFQHSFSHIFAGGYAAGYYSYKWAEVLSSDAFSRFEEEGVFNEATGRDFLRSILEVGGSRPASDSFLEFRKREPRLDALLKHNGIKIT